MLLKIDPAAVGPSEPYSYKNKDENPTHRFRETNSATEFVESLQGNTKLDPKWFTVYTLDTQQRRGIGTQEKQHKNFINRISKMSR